MTKGDEKVTCKTPTPGKQGTNIAKWKYERIRKAILQAVPTNQNGMEFQDVCTRVKELLSDEEREKTRVDYVVYRHCQTRSRSPRRD